MIYNYRGYKYDIGDECMRVFDTRGVEIAKMDVWKSANHLHAHVYIDAKLNKKPKVTIGLYETEPYHWDVYYKGKVYLGSVRQVKGGYYICFSHIYETKKMKDIQGIMNYFRRVAKEKGL